MKYSFQEFTVKDLVDLGMIEQPLDGNHGSVHPKSSDYVDNGVPFLMANDIIDGCVDLTKCAHITEEQAKTLRKGFAHPGDVLLTHKATIGRTAILDDDYPLYILTPQITYYRVIKGIDKHYLKYYFDSPFFQSILLNWASSGSTRLYLGITAQLKLPVFLPELSIQNKISKILKSIDDKIILNNKINDNLEHQIETIFKDNFILNGKNDSNRYKPLSDLVDVIDNRGKTPPLTLDTFDYPIIDVGALKGDGRIINFNNCTKYVDESTYNTWFRNGHPKVDDLLISTVGSLAEMKVYKGKKGCIAQNVVALRSKKISPLYIYQYMKYIKDDLVSYNIGSVQPSIKVTHFIKHLIYVPSDEELSEFNALSESMTNVIEKNCIENENLINLRDTLLPKLMSGEIDVSNIKLDL